jgi:hypothetical protein|tara:strand:+ start:2431 stop:2688 length:258 start_codon:yes stop_codon:yes gene_type:complete
MTSIVPEVKKGFSVIIHEHKLIGRKVSNKEYGIGYIRAIETFPHSSTESRYIIEIIDNTGKPILKSLFPDNKMAFWKREFELLTI